MKLRLFFILFLTFIFSCSKKIGKVSIEKSNLTKSSNELEEWIVGFNSNLTSSFISNSGDEWCHYIKIGSDGSIFLGCFTNGEMFASNTTSKGRGVIAKLDKNGKFIWARQLSTDEPLINASFNGNATLNGIDINSKGEVFFFGRAMGDLADTLAGSKDIFWGKVNSDGTLAYIKQAGVNTMSAYATSSGFATASSSSDEECGSMALLSDGSFVLSGHSKSTMADLNSSGAEDIVLLKINEINGDIISIKQLGENFETSYISGGGYALADFSSRDMYPGLLANSSNHIFINFVTNGSLAEANGGSNDLLWAKFDENLNLVYLKQYGTSSAAAYAAIGGNYASSASGGEWPGAMHLGTDGKWYIGMRTTGDIGDDKLGGNDVAFFRVDPSNGNVEKAFQLGINSGAGSTGHDLIGFLSLNEKNEIIVSSGSYATYANLPILSSGGLQYFLTKLDYNGNHIKSVYFAGPPGSKTATGAISYFTGGYILDNGSYILAHETPHPIEGFTPTGTDIFIYKLKDSSVFSDL